MHELSIAQSLVEVVTETASREGASRVEAVHLRLGVLSGVVRGALEFCYEIATAGTLLEGSKLYIEELPVTVYCGNCRKEVELPDVTAFRCPVCGGFTADIRQGKELEVRSVELLVDESEAANVHPCARDPERGPQQE